MSHLFGKLIRHDWRKDFERAWRHGLPADAELDDEALETVRADLLQHIARWVRLDRDEGHLVCRNHVMDSIERLCLKRGLWTLDPDTRDRVASHLNEFRHLDRELGRHILAEELRISVLREWSGRYYGDRARGDWYDTYRQAAEMRMDSIGRDFERIAGLPVHVVQDNRDAAIRGLNAALRLRLLQVPRGRAVSYKSLRTRMREIFKNGDEAYEHDG